MPAWTLFTKRTEDPKLAWLEQKLDQAGIACRRNGDSYHAPILEVDDARLSDAWDVLQPVDDMPDDDPTFVDDAGGCACGEPEAGQCAFCQVDEAVQAILERGATTT